jgi:hypothetical protein
MKSIEIETGYLSEEYSLKCALKAFIEQNMNELEILEKEHGKKNIPNERLYRKNINNSKTILKQINKTINDKRQTRSRQDFQSRHF